MTRMRKLGLAAAVVLPLGFGSCARDTCCVSCTDHIALRDAVLMHQKTLEQWRDWNVNTAFPALQWAVSCLQRTNPTWPCSGGPGITPPPDSLPRKWP